MTHSQNVSLAVCGHVPSDAVSHLDGRDICHLVDHLFVVVKAIREHFWILLNELDSDALDVCWSYVSHLMSPVGLSGELVDVYISDGGGLVARGIVQRGNVIHHTTIKG